MRPQSIVMLVDGAVAPDAPNPAGSGGLSELISRTLDPQEWRLVRCDNVESAQEHFLSSPISGLVPELVVLNVDVARGWPFCTTLKKNFATVPVIVVSERLNKEVFNGHQKLDTRADAYHRLPEELDGLEISLGYFASHKSETGEEDEGSSPRLKPRKAGRIAVPSGLLQKLESTVAEQARALEDARQKIEALEAERDAVADKGRRQVIELMALHPGDSGAEVASLRDKVAALEAKTLEAARLDEEARLLRASLGAAKAEVARLGERPDAEALVTRLQGEVQSLKAGEVELRQALDARAVELAALTTERDQLAQRQEKDRVRVSSPGMQPPAAALEEAREDARREAVEAADQLAKASVQLSTLATELKNSHERRLQAEEALRKAEARAVELEQELSQRPASQGADLEARLIEALARAEAAERTAATASTRLEQFAVYAQGAATEVERVNAEKKAVDEALAMSRRLMREYATDAARKADELKEEQARVKALAERAEAAERRAAELTQSAEFGSSLVDSLEREVAELRARTAVADTGEREVLQKNLEQLAAGYRGLQTDLERVNAELEEARAQVFALEAERDHVVGKAGLAEQELARVKKELDGVGLEHEAMLENLQQEFGELVKRHAADAASLVAERADKLALAGRIEKLTADVDQEKRARQFVYDAMAAHAEVVAQRFAALREYSRRLEARLIEAEGQRAELETRLESLLFEVRAQALYGEVPPEMEIPLAPVFIDDDEDDEDADDGPSDEVALVSSAAEAIVSTEIGFATPAEPTPRPEVAPTSVENAGNESKNAPTGVENPSSTLEVAPTGVGNTTSTPEVAPTSGENPSSTLEVAPTSGENPTVTTEIAGPPPEGAVA